MPVVREFLDVFLKDLSGLPLNKELEFEIELLSGSAPIFIPPYRMAPAELKKIKDPTSRFGRQGFHQTRCIFLGCTGIVCKEERWNHAIMYQLLATQ